MPVCFAIPQTEIGSPSWEPTDCSTRALPGGGVELYCHFSKRRIAVADSANEAKAALKLARIVGLLQTLDLDRKQGESPALLDLLSSKIASFQSELSDRDRAVEIHFA